MVLYRIPGFAELVDSFREVELELDVEGQPIDLGAVRNLVLVEAPGADVESG